MSHAARRVRFRLAAATRPLAVSRAPHPSSWPKYSRRQAPARRAGSTSPGLCRTASCGVAMSRIWAWIAFAIGMIYFFVPLIGTLEFSLRMRRGVYSLDAYRVVLADPRFQADLHLFGDHGAAHHPDGRADRGAHRLLGPAEAAALAADHRVPHPAAAGDPGDRHRLRLHPPLQHLLDPAAHRHRLRHQLPAPHRLHHARAPLHVPRRRHRPARHRRRHPDRGRPEPRRRLAHHHVRG